MVKRYPESIKYLSESTQIVIKTISNRVDSGKNALGIFVGGTGTGKSFDLLALHKGIYEYRRGVSPTPKYLIDHCMFKSEDLLERLNEPDKLKIGECWGLDEAGVIISQKTHWSKQNLAINYLCQTFRNLRQVLLLSVPSMGFIDSNIRKLLHYYFETSTIDHKKKLSIVKPLILQFNVRMDKLFFHNFSYPSREKGLIIVNQCSFPLLPKEYIDAYDIKKTAFTRELNMNIQALLRRDNGPGSVQARLTDRQKEIIKLLEDGTTSPTKIGEILGVDQSTISTNFGYLRRKGINIDKFLKEKPESKVMNVSVASAT